MIFTFLHIPWPVLNGFPLKLTTMAINHDRFRGDGYVLLRLRIEGRKTFLHVPPLRNHRKAGGWFLREDP
jgi:hypothetical protein